MAGHKKCAKQIQHGFWVQDWDKIYTSTDKYIDVFGLKLSEKGNKRKGTEDDMKKLHKVVEFKAFTRGNTFTQLHPRTQSKLAHLHTDAGKSFNAVLSVKSVVK